MMGYDLADRREQDPEYPRIRLAQILQTSPLMKIDPALKKRSTAFLGEIRR